MCDHQIQLTVNGTARTLDLDPQTPLLLALRNHLGLRGARAGCGIGECGACTVLLDGAPTRACITPVSAVGEATVTTPEGLGTRGELHPVQHAFLEEQAAQCGYCINGIIMTTVARGRIPEGDRPDPASALEGHLCRCGTHARILAAVGAVSGGDVPGHSCVRMEPAEDADVAVYPEASDLHVVGTDVSGWVELLPDGRVAACTGKVELGQGIRTALAQIVSAELYLQPDDVIVRSASTGTTPDEGYTAGSNSLETSGRNLAQAAVALRRLILDRAAARLGCRSSEVELRDGHVILTRTGDELSLATVRSTGEIAGPVLASDVPGRARSRIGVSVPRDDLRAKLTGAPAYVHDLDLPNMLHARVLLPPQQQARLASIDLEAARHLEGVTGVVADGSLVIVIAAREEQAIRAISRLERRVRWDMPRLGLTDADVVRHLEQLPSQPYIHRRGGDVDGIRSAPRRLRASYSKPYQLHGAMAPSCAVAQDRGDVLTVWTHSQGVYPLRRELARLLDRSEDRLRIIHADGPGCYGHNAADDVAALAALAATAADGRPVRLQLTIHDEFAWEPYGSAMSAELEAGYDPASGRLTVWRSRIRTDVHGVRPNGDGDRLVAAWLREDGLPRPWPGPAESGARNAEPPYDIPIVDVVAHYVRGPLRTGSLRSLGAFFNLFAVESFMDELADACHRDPLDFRLTNLGDDRARTVLRAAADAAGWKPRVGPSGDGQGLAVGRYKGTKAYVAAVVDATFAEDVGRIDVHRVVMACDAGRVVNPDGLVNQLQGGALQALSRTLHEEVRLDDRGVRSRDWTDYDVLGFSEVPRIDVVLVDRQNLPPLGAGESATPPVAAALANALDDAIGIRVRDLPLTSARLEDRVLALTDDEQARVRL